MYRSKRCLIVGLFFTLAAAPVAAPAIADDDLDHELARQALSEGRIRPLTEILETLKTEFPGQILGVELESKGVNSFIYEFKVLTPDGKLKEVKVDAATSKILTIQDDD